MPSSEVKHRKGKTAAAQDGDTNGTKTRKEGAELCGAKPSLDLKTTVSFLSLSVCFVLTWIVLQQNARFNEVEEKYRHLYEKTVNLHELEEKLGAASKKLEASEDHLKDVLTSVTLVTRLDHDIASLTGVITAMQEHQDASSHRLQKVNEHFLNVTEEWQGGLGTVTDELASLRSESRSIHAHMTEQVNEAETRLRALAERLEEVEDGTRRNARLLERTEEEDAQRVQNQLDWNTRQVSRLQEQLRQLFRKDAELLENLEETEPRAKECETQLPTVEDAVRSILRLAADLSSTERRLEELTLQVLGTEDSMLKALAEILELRQVLDNIQVDNSVMKVRNEVEVMLEAMKHLQREQDLDFGRDLQPDQGKDFENNELADLDVENVQQLSTVLKNLEKSGLMESPLDNNDGRSTGTEEDPLPELNDLL